MDGFNFFFGFYGLMLGFSVAVVTSGLANLVSKPRESSIRLFMLVGIFMLLDLISLWVFAWDSRQYLGVDYPSLYAAMMIAIVYYFAAALIFPREFPEADILNVYWENKRWLIVAVAIASGCTELHEIWYQPGALVQWHWWLMQATYWVPLTWLFFTRAERSDTILWLILVAGYLYEAIVEVIKPAAS